MKKPFPIENNKTLLFRFVTSYSMIIILTLVLGFFFLLSVRTTSRDYTYRQNYTLFKESVGEMDASLRLLSTLTAQIGSNTHLKNLSSQTERNAHYYTLSKESMTYLSDIMVMQDILPVDSFYVYLPDSGYLISPTLFMDRELYYKFDRGFQNDLYDTWLSMVSSYDNCRTLLPLSRFQSQLSSYLYKLPLSAFHSDIYQPAIACFELDTASMKAYFQTVMESPYAMVYVTDEKNAPLFTLSSDYTPKKPVAELAAIADRSSSPYQTEEFREGLRGYTITKITSGFNRWQYYLIQPNSYLLNDLTTYQVTYLIVILLFGILTFLLVYWMSRTNIKPFEQMTNRLETSRQENLTLQDALQKQRPLVYSAYVARIMKGSVSSEQDVREIADFLQIKGLGERSFFVLYVSVKLEQLEFYTEEGTEASQSPSRLNEYETMLYRSFYKYFGSDILIYHPDVNSFALLLSSEEKPGTPALLQSLEDTFTTLHNELLKEHSIWIFGGLGDSNKKLPFFWKSYQQALEAASHTTDETIFLSYKHLNRSSGLYYYPFEMAQQLTSFIQAANTLQIQEIFKLIHRENADYRSLSVETMKWLLSDLRTTLVKIRYSMEDTPENKEFFIRFDTALQIEQTLDGMEQLALELASCFRRKPEGNQLIARIQEYITKNYYDANLSLKKISEEFSISESYFSYLFKTETGRNFSEYLEELRMSQAMILIRETDTPLSELYSHLGYNNPNSFRRAFKKVYGDSPKAFRTSGGTET